MRQERCHFEASLFLKPSERSADWVFDLLKSIPDRLVPEYFGRSEQLLKRPEFRVSNTIALEKYAVSTNYYWFFGRSYELMIECGGHKIPDISLFASSLSIGTQLMLEWLPRLEPRLYYVNAGVPDEFEHRNGHSMNILGVSRPAHGWLGRDIRCYVPGLYWLNYFSTEFISKHNINPPSLAERSAGQITQSAYGTTLRLYDSPASWVEWSERIDEILYTTSGFFSMRRVQLPTELLPLNESVQKMVELGRQWP